MSADAFEQEIFRKQRPLLGRAYLAVRTLRLMFANHPAGSKVPVIRFSTKARSATSEGPASAVRTARSSGEGAPNSRCRLSARGYDPEVRDFPLFIYSDASPTDWMKDGEDEKWHTIVNVSFPIDLNLDPLISAGALPHDVLSKDTRSARFFASLKAQLPNGRLRKWSASKSYKTAIASALADVLAPGTTPCVAAVSFQEKVLRRGEKALNAAFNGHLRAPGRGIGFARVTDNKGREIMQHEFVNGRGYHKIAAPESQLLVMLLMTWFAADQYIFHSQNIATQGRLFVTLVSDRLSGDNHLKTPSEQVLRHLIDPHEEPEIENDTTSKPRPPIVLTRSPTSDTEDGDLLVDNLAGWLNTAIGSPKSKLAARIPTIDVNWRVLEQSDDTLRFSSALDRFSAKGPPSGEKT